MNADGQIDDLFRRGLGDQDPGPQMHLWPGVANRLRRPFLSPRRIGIYALLALGLTAFLCSDQRMLEVDITIRQAIALDRAPVPDHPELANRSTVPTQAKSDPQNNWQSLSAASSSFRADRPVQSRRTSILRSRKLSLVPETGEHHPVAASGQDISPVAHLAPEETPDTRGSMAEMAVVETRATPFTPYPVDDLIPPIRFLGERWFAGLDLSYSQDWMQRGLYPKTADYAPYAQLRNTTEAFQRAHTAALRLSLISASGITLRGGIQVTRFAERFTHTSEERQLRFLPRRDATGNVIGTDTVLQLVQIPHNNLNRFQTVDIPLTIGYEFPWGKANFSLHAGPVFNMAFYQQGRFLAEDGERIADFSSSTPDAYPAFRNRLSMGFYGSVNLSYPLTPSVHLFAEPYLRVFPAAFTNSDYPLDQRYRMQGVFIGIRKVMGPYWMNLRP
jgi:hypothetical protein